MALLYVPNKVTHDSRFKQLWSDIKSNFSKIEYIGDSNPLIFEVEKEGLKYEFYRLEIDSVFDNEYKNETFKFKLKKAIL